MSNTNTNTTELTPKEAALEAAKAHHAAEMKEFIDKISESGIETHKKYKKEMQDLQDILHKKHVEFMTFLKTSIFDFLYTRHAQLAHLIAPGDIYKSDDGGTLVIVTVKSVGEKSVLVDMDVGGDVKEIEMPASALVIEFTIESRFTPHSARECCGGSSGCSCESKPPAPAGEVSSEASV